MKSKTFFDIHKQPKFPKALSLSKRRKKQGDVHLSQTKLEEVQHQSKVLADDLPPLLLAADRVASTVAQGVHGRRRSGQGESFWQFRPYHNEDSKNRIDWRRSAKSDALYVRETEWEAAQSIWFWRDNAASMNYASSPSHKEKGDFANILLLATANLSLRAGEHIGLVRNKASKDAIRGSNKNTLIRIAQTLIENKYNDVHEVDLSAFAQDVPSYSHMVLMSDFLESPEIFEKRLRILAERKIKASFLCLFDPAEKSLPFRGRIRFTGLKKETPLLVRKAQAMRDDYTSKRQAHFKYLSDLVRHYGWRWLSYDCSAPAEQCLLNLYHILDDRPMRVRR